MLAGAGSIAMRHAASTGGAAPASSRASALRLAAMRAHLAAGGATSWAIDVDGNVEGAPQTHQAEGYVQTPLAAGQFGFHLGQPGRDLIPLQTIKNAFNSAVPDNSDPLMLQYRTPVDFLACRESLAEWLTEEHGVEVRADQLAMTPGNSAALGLIFANHNLRRPSPPGSPCVAVVENPTYFLAGGMLADVGIEARSCPVDDDGLVVDRVAAMCAAGDPPHFVYTIPNYHNPLGVTVRERLSSTLHCLSLCFHCLSLCFHCLSLCVFTAFPCVFSLPYSA